VKTTEAIMEILAAYDLTQSYRDAAALADCAPNTVARYVVARDAGELKTAPAQRSELIDPFRDKIEEWVDASHGRIRADVAQRKLEPMGYTGSERTTRRAVAEAKATYRAGHRRRFRPWLPEPGPVVSVGLRRRLASIIQTTQVSKQAADARPQPVVFAYGAPPARFPVAYQGTDEP
jgi:hypothetical protein